MSLEYAVAEQIGPKRGMTWDGFLLCQDVPIARIGTMVYTAGELALEPDSAGLVRVERDADELFDPASVATWAGKPVTNDHPPEDADVTPENWNDLAVGTVLNPRQGSGDLDTHLVADLLITQQRAIRDVLAGKVEVSAGYTPNYRQVAPGRAVQAAIRGNHVAVVEKGRCGPSCAVRDHAGPVAGGLRGSAADGAVCGSMVDIARAGEAFWRARGA